MYGQRLSFSPLAAQSACPPPSGWKAHLDLPHSLLIPPPNSSTHTLLFDLLPFPAVLPNLPMQTRTPPETVQTTFRKEHRSQDFCWAPSAGQMQYFLWRMHRSHAQSPLVLTSSSTYLRYQFLKTQDLWFSLPQEWLQQPLWPQHHLFQIALLKIQVSFPKQKAIKRLGHLPGKSATLPTLLQCLLASTANLIRDNVFFQLFGLRVASIIQRTLGI